MARTMNLKNTLSDKARKAAIEAAVAAWLMTRKIEVITESKNRKQRRAEKAGK
ncbi:hypothetical protein ACWA5Z_06615 [Testudinibacter sp. P80/BLE/0925]